MTFQQNLEAPDADFAPFGRSQAALKLTDEDLRLLAGTPEPLKVLVPVLIEE